MKNIMIAMITVLTNVKTTGVSPEGKTSCNFYLNFNYLPLT